MLLSNWQETIVSISSPPPPPGLLFPMEMCTVLWYYIWSQCVCLCLQLGLPESTLCTIEFDYPKSVDTCRDRVVQRQVNSLRLNPSWYSLVNVLHGVGLCCLATEDIMVSCKQQSKVDAPSTAPCIYDLPHYRLLSIHFLHTYLGDSTYWWCLLNWRTLCRSYPSREASRCTEFIQNGRWWLPDRLLQS